MGSSAWQFNLLLVSQSIYQLFLHPTRPQLFPFNGIQLSAMQLHVAYCRALYRCVQDFINTLIDSLPKRKPQGNYGATALATPLNPFLFWQHTKPWPPQRTRKYICKCPRRNHNTIVNSIPYLAHYTELCTAYSILNTYYIVDRL